MPCCSYRRWLRTVSGSREAVRGDLGTVGANKSPSGTSAAVLLAAALGLGGATGVACRCRSAQKPPCTIAELRRAPIHDQVLGYASETRGSIWWHGRITSSGLFNACSVHSGQETSKTLPWRSEDGAMQVTCRQFLTLQRPQVTEIRKAEFSQAVFHEI